MAKSLIEELPRIVCEGRREDLADRPFRNARHQLGRARKNLPRTLQGRLILSRDRASRDNKRSPPSGGLLHSLRNP